jgi:hypothetical protein
VGKHTFTAPEGHSGYCRDCGEPGVDLLPDEDCPATSFAAPKAAVTDPKNASPTGASDDTAEVSTSPASAAAGAGEEQPEA